MSPKDSTIRSGRLPVEAPSAPGHRFAPTRPALGVAPGLLSGTAGAISFQDASIMAGFSGSGTETWGGGTWGDYNGDRYPDLFTQNHRERAVLYRNNKNGTFSDVSQQVDGSRTPGWTGGRVQVDHHGDTWGDLDNDGDQDLIIGVSSSDDQVMINEGGALVNRSTAWGTTRTSSGGGGMRHRATRMPLLFDYTGDGLLDIAFVSLSRPSLYPQDPPDYFSSALRYELGCVKDGSFGTLIDVTGSPGLEFLCAPRNGVYPSVVYNFSSGSPVNVSGAVPTRNRVNDAIAADFDGDLRNELFEIIGSARPSGAV